MRAKTTCGLLSVVLAMSVPRGAAASSGSASSDPAATNRVTRSVRSAQRERFANAESGAVPAVPQPFPADRADLRSAFTKTVPTSLADLRSMQEQVQALAARVSPAVVAVEVGSGSGSGVVVSADGLVLTAGHVCGAPGRDVVFTFPSGKTAHGKTVGADPENDTGLLRITDRGPWPHVEVGDLQQARIGDWVLALGHPGGFDLRRSLVVRLGRIIQFEPALQTDCTIAPGDSGGPLIDMHGRVVGIHSAISPSVADNFHVPITAFYDTWAVLVKNPGPANKPDKPQAYVGVEGADELEGCRLTSVAEDGPAAKAGLKVGDVVVKVDGREVPVYASFLRWVAEAEPGETLNLEVKRGDKRLSVEVKLAATPKRRP